MRGLLPVVLLLAGCAGAPEPRAPSVPGPDVPSQAPGRAAPEPVALPPGALALAEVGGQPVLAGEVYPLLYLAHHEITVEALRQAVVSRLVQLEQARAGVEVPRELLVKETEQVLKDFDEKIGQGTGGQMGLKDYVPEVLGLTMEEYRAWVERSVTTSLQLERLILFELGAHPRIQIRLIRVADRSLAEELLDKLRRGADFAVLAREHSDDASKQDGGLYPSLPLDLGYPLFESLDQVRSGDYDEVREFRTDAGTRYRILQVVTRLAPEGGTYADRKGALERELDARVISPLELDAWMRIMERRHGVQVFGLGRSMQAGQPKTTERPEATDDASATGNDPGTDRSDG